MTTQLALPTCLLPGCTNIVADPTKPCDDCRAAFGDWLRESDRPPPPQAELDQQNARYREVMAERARLIAAAEAGADRQIAIGTGHLRKPNQVCWMCEERRSCTRVGDRWECDRCQGVS